MTKKNEQAEFRANERFSRKMITWATFVTFNVGEIGEMLLKQTLPWDGSPDRETTLRNQRKSLARCGSEKLTKLLPKSVFIYHKKCSHFFPPPLRSKWQGPGWNSPYNGVPFKMGYVNKGSLTLGPSHLSSRMGSHGPVLWPPRYLPPSTDVDPVIPDRLSDSPPGAAADLTHPSTSADLNPPAVRSKLPGAVIFCDMVVYF